MKPQPKQKQQSMIQLSRTQDEEVGDGTTSVIVLAGELLQAAEPLLERNLHPTVLVRGYARALEGALAVARDMAFPIDVKDRAAMLNVVQSCIGTKYTSRFGTLMAVRALICLVLLFFLCAVTTTRVCVCVDGSNINNQKTPTKTTLHPPHQNPKHCNNRSSRSTPSRPSRPIWAAASSRST
jgi:hypothetical protein